MPQGKARRVSPRLLKLVVVVILGLVVVAMPTGLYVLKPGPVGDLSAMVALPDGRQAAGGRLLMVTIRADRATPLAILVAAFEPGWDVIPGSGLIPPGQSEEEYLQSAAKQMTESQRTAVLVASAYLGRELPQVEFDVGPIAGPSAGVMFALEIVRQATGSPPADGMVVAGSGALLPDGRVTAVGGVRQKVIAARRAGAGLFIVPRAEADAAVALAGGMKVIPVDDFRQAIQALTTAGTP